LKHQVSEGGGGRGNPKRLQKESLLKSITMGLLGRKKGGPRGERKRLEDRKRGSKAHVNLSKTPTGLQGAETGEGKNSEDLKKP